MEPYRGARAHLTEILRKAVETAVKEGRLTTAAIPNPVVERPKREGQGDYASPLAMTLASSEKRPPAEIAEILIRSLKETGGFLERAEAAGPGFINFTVSPDWWRRRIPDILAAGERYGTADRFKGKRVLIEYVSANPTGPLHVGHGRWAAIGSAMTRLLRAVGYEAVAEFYINDAGRQVRLLGQSVHARYRQILGHSDPDPEEAYRGEYITGLAERMRSRIGRSFEDKPLEDGLMDFTRFAMEEILGGIRRDLDDFGVRFDSWFSEASLFDNGAVGEALEELRRKDFLYEKEGALWFRSTAFGDDKDRVVRREDGEYTYLASDIAYHRNKLKRGFDPLINIWGADHHGYVSRIEAVVQALGYSRECLVIKIGQLVALVRAGQPVAMSKRSGDYVTLRDLLDEVGKDAALFIFLTRRLDSPLEFDLELAKRQSNDNPVYYVQYAHARLCSVLREAEKKGVALREASETRLERLEASEELALIRKLCQYPELIEDSAQALEPHRITFYLQELAALLHQYYYRHRILSEDEELSQARLLLVTAVRVAIRNALGILGVSAPERM